MMKKPIADKPEGLANECAEIAHVYEEINLVMLEAERILNQSQDWEKANQLLDSLEVKENILSRLAIDLPLKRLSREAGIEMSKLLELKQNLREDWFSSVRNMRYFDLFVGWNTGAYFGDYDDKAYQTPSADDIFKRIKPEQLKSWVKMEELGMQPRLQLTPIGYKIETLLEKFKAKKDHLVNRQGQLLVHDVRQPDKTFDERKLKYGINEVKIVDAPARNTKSITFGGTLTKGQWIEKNRGFLVEIVATQRWIIPELAKEADLFVEQSPAAIFTQKSLEKFKELGFSAKSVESHLVMLMNETQAGEMKNIDTLALLPETNWPNTEYIASCHYTAEKDIGIGGYSSQSGRDTMWVPPTIKLDF